MTISSIYLDRETSDAMGIGEAELPLDSPLSMQGLGSVVLLAGPNGAGKSRLLRLLERLAQKSVSEEQRNELLQRLGEMRSSVKTQEDAISSAERQSPPGFNLPRMRSTLQNTRDQMASAENVLKFDAVLKRASSNVPVLVRFVPNNPSLDDPGQIPDSQATTLHRAMSSQRTSEGVHQRAAAYAREILREELATKQTNWPGSDDERVALKIRKDSLCALVERMLGPTMTLMLDGSLNITLGGHRQYTHRLSPGQKILFQFVCLLHAQSAQLDNCVVLMDEPENHLHPAALNEIVDRLRLVIPNGQLWIATHSIPLIAHILHESPEALWFVKDGNVSRGGRSPEKVLESLLGGAHGVDRIQGLTRLPAQYATTRFLTECLTAPKVADANVGDPQTRQIAETLLKLQTSVADKRLRVLDFGAGKGRLLHTLSEANSSTLSVDYYAYDVSDEHRESCNAEIQRAYPNDSSTRWFSCLHTLASELNEGSVHVVVMCNVLHELPPDQWLAHFSATSRLAHVLSPQGGVLFVEDYGIPVGERAHEYGFLLLDTPELRSLFDVKEEDRESFLRQTSDEARYKNRLVAHFVRKNLLTKISSDTQKRALRSLRDRMRDELRGFLREEEANNAMVGRDYGRAAQLFANASLWLNAHDDSQGN